MIKKRGLTLGKFAPLHQGHQFVIVDVIGIWLYYVKEVRIISLLYVILLVMAINGWLNWNKTLKTAEPVAYSQP
jgi:nicotinamide riboside transporter PnuC